MLVTLCGFGSFILLPRIQVIRQKSLNNNTSLIQAQLLGEGSMKNVTRYFRCFSVPM